MEDSPPRSRTRSQYLSPGLDSRRRYGRSSSHKRRKDDTLAETSSRSSSHRQSDTRSNKTRYKKRDHNFSAPIYFKVHPDHLARRTLGHYDIPWEYDKNGYITILRELDNDQLDELFEHTYNLRRESQRGPQEENERSGEHGLQPEPQVDRKIQANNTLCDNCTKIPFGDLRGFQDTKTFYLGTVGEVRARSHCRFCRLVNSAMRSLYHRRLGSTSDDLEDSEKVNVTWHDRDAGFEISLFTPMDTRISFESKADDRYHGVHVISESQLDPKLLIHWMETCERVHGNGCAPLLSLSVGTSDTSSQLSNFRVIDVQANCVINAPTDCRYIALSYVWGHVPAIRLCKMNENVLMSQHGLCKVWDKLPKTVTDAIDLVRMIRERYLWIDALCLIQDDKADMHEGVQKMDIVYENAFMTVIGAVGVDASSGLPGVQSYSRRCTQTVSEVAPGFRMVVVHGLDDYLINSEYSRRAWTFQEQVLSTRKLVFADNRVYFRCNQRTWSEEDARNDYSPTTWYNPTSATGSLMSAILKPGSSAYDKYVVLLLYYSKRKLSNQNDAVNAMAGLLRRISDQTGGHILEGLPTACFDASLTFLCNGNRKPQRRSEFPSYSWAGWISGVNISHINTVCGVGEPDGESVKGWLDDHTWIVWYKRSAAGTLSLVWDPAAEDTTLPARDINARYGRRGPFKHHNCFLGDITQTIPTEHFASLVQPRPYHLLQFWTITVYFTLSSIGRDPYEPKDESKYANVNDREGRLAGWLSLDGKAPDTPLFEFIVLSESWYSLNERRLPCRPSTWDLYFVLLIDRDGGVAERRGLGQIYKTAIDHSFPPGPVWKEILLG